MELPLVLLLLGSGIVLIFLSASLDLLHILKIASGLIPVLACFTGIYIVVLIASRFPFLSWQESGIRGTDIVAARQDPVGAALNGRDDRILLDLRRAPTMRSFLHILYQPYKWLVVIPFLLLSTLLLGAVAIVIATTVSPKLASATCGVWWSRLNGIMTPMLVSARGRRHIDEEQSYVIISNHLSHYDIFVLYGWLGIDFKWVMKKELRSLPALGFACEKMGHIYIDRSNRETAIASLAAAKKGIVNGTSILFFPEGTRSSSGEMGEFKKGAFVMALDLGIPILPITILHTDKILPPRTMDLFPGRASMVVHEPIDVAGYGMERLGDLMAAVREVIQAGQESE